MDVLIDVAVFTYGLATGVFATFAAGLFVFYKLGKRKQ